MEIIYSNRFSRMYKKLPTEVKLEAEKREIIFRKNPFASVLKTHKLAGRLKDFWSFSINYKYRIIFEFGTDNIVYFHWVGQHRIYI
ncbi:MAG: type II toxin-antitoxin system YafQ family toxin [Candidatus Komeilibacteria bacterium]